MGFDTYVRVHRSRGTQQGFTNHNKFLPDNGFGYAARTASRPASPDRKAHARRDRQPQRAGADRGDPRLGRQRVHVGRVAARCRFATPANTKGTGMPARRSRSRLTTHGVAQRAGFVHLASGGNEAAPPATTTTTNAPRREGRRATTGSNGCEPRPGRALRRRPRSTRTAAASRRRALHPDQPLLVLVVVLFVGVLLRRRAVKRQRARRIGGNARGRRRCAAAASRSSTVVTAPARGSVRRSSRRSACSEAATHIDLTKDEPSGRPHAGPRAAPVRR